MNILEQILQDDAKHTIPPELLQVLYKDQRASAVEELDEQPPDDGSAEKGEDNDGAA